MVSSIRGKRIQEAYSICQVEGEDGDFVRIRRPGAKHTRVARAHLEAGVITEEGGHLVATESIKNLRSYREFLVERLADRPPRLPADRLARIDSEVEALVKSKAESTSDSFNDVLRRLLGLDAHGAGRSGADGGQPATT